MSAFQSSIRRESGRTPLSLLAMSFFFCLLTNIVVAKELTGRVVGVLDGDTIDVLADETSLFRIRLSGIDAPEKGQPFGQAAKALMSKLAFQKTVIVTWRKKDRYGRLVGKVEHAQTDLGLEMIKAGLAWHYKKYQSEQTKADSAQYGQAEREAQISMRGLWTEKEPIAPWDYRAGGRKPKV